ncbi:hypothetical protein NE857_17190 [Nocardiopsis exhalans]|uniref:Uncharacterized protein n=1 Tax=Nocardiopsis exhalans TaxID=163604 RepID=A0ABY5D1Z2_9ACTN|nr:hypothetical protein [Nocardiopsis exhalans]USY17098.1 hypothetical protein NE857_17190 [Nocardiopsis exhalans]
MSAPRSTDPTGSTPAAAGQSATSAAGTGPVGADPRSAPRGRNHSPGTRHPPASFLPYGAALAWSAAALGMALGWLTGVVPPGLSEASAFGALLTTDHLGVAASVTFLVGALGVVIALLLPRSHAPRLLEVSAWTVFAVLLLAYIDSTLLVWLGYGLAMPVLVWVEPALGVDYVALTLSAPLLQTLYFTAGAGIWAWASLTHRRRRLDGCVRCGRTTAWTPDAERALRGQALRTGRIAVVGAFALALFYPALRLPWLFGYSMGMAEEAFAAVASDPTAMMIGLGLGAAGVLGAVLMLGLVQGWGVRFPWWMVGLSGRRVPVSLAVLPATLVAMALVGMGRSVLVQFWQLGGVEPGMGSHAVAFGAMPLWGAALAVATAAYAVRRRAECAVCGRGLPEAWPVAAPPLLPRKR